MIFPELLTGGRPSPLSWNNYWDLRREFRRTTGRGAKRGRGGLQEYRSAMVENISGGVASAPSISMVIPVYQCGGCLASLCERLEQTLTKITDRYEIILVDDRSPDNAWDAI